MTGNEIRGGYGIRFHNSSNFNLILSGKPSAFFKLLNTSVCISPKEHHFKYPHYNCENQKSTIPFFFFLIYRLCLQILANPSIMPFTAKENPRSHVVFSCHVSSLFYCGKYFLNISLDFMVLTLLTKKHLLYKVFHSLGLYDVFS